MSVTRCVAVATGGKPISTTGEVPTAHSVVHRTVLGSDPPVHWTSCAGGVGPAERTDRPNRSADGTENDAQDAEGHR